MKPRNKVFFKSIFFLVALHSFQFLYRCGASNYEINLRKFIEDQIVIEIEKTSPLKFEIERSSLYLDGVEIMKLSSSGKNTIYFATYSAYSDHATLYLIVKELLNGKERKYSLESKGYIYDGI